MADIRLNAKGVAELMQSAGVRAELETRMRRVQAEAGVPTELSVKILPSGRPVVTVTDPREDSLFREMRSGRLTRALAAADAKREPVGSKWGPRRVWVQS